MKLATSILLFAVCASAQIVPPMVQVHKIEQRSLRWGWVAFIAALIVIIFSSVRGADTSQKANGVIASAGHPLMSLRPSQGAQALMSNTAESSFIPSMAQSPVVVQHKVPTPQPIGLQWSSSVSPDVIGYWSAGYTNGTQFEATLTGAATNVTLESWPGTNRYEVEAINSSGIYSAPAVVTHSAFAIDRTLALNAMTNGVLYTNQPYSDLVNLPSPSFFRTAVNVAMGTVALQMSASPLFSSPSNLLVEDLDNFPSIADYNAVILKKIVNVP